MSKKPTGIERLQAELSFRTQAEIATLLEWSQQAVCQWVDGGTDPKHLYRVRMHHVLGIPWDVPWR